MDKNELLRRTRAFAIKVFKFVDHFPKTEATKVVTYQLLKSSSSIAANYRAANKAKSKSDFTNELKIVLEGADESNFWLTFASDIGLVRSENPSLSFLVRNLTNLLQSLPHQSKP